MNIDATIPKIQIIVKQKKKFFYKVISANNTEEYKIGDEISIRKIKMIRTQGNIFLKIKK